MLTSISKFIRDVLGVKEKPIHPKLFPYRYKAQALRADGVMCDVEGVVILGQPLVNGSTAILREHIANTHFEAKDRVRADHVLVLEHNIVGEA